MEKITTDQTLGDVKPWPKRSRKKTQVENLSLLATPFGQSLRALALTCDDLRSFWSRSNLHASFSPFGHPTQVNASWVTSINGLLANEIQDTSALQWVFWDLRVLVRKLASPFGHPTQVSTQVQLAATCDYLQVRLARTLDEASYWDGKLLTDINLLLLMSDDW